MTQDQVLTLKEVAALLKIAERTAYSMLQAGELPGFKVGGQWRFKWSDIAAETTKDCSEPAFPYENAVECVGEKPSPEHLRIMTEPVGSRPLGASIYGVHDLAGMQLKASHNKRPSGSLRLKAINHEVRSARPIISTSRTAFKMLTDRRSHSQPGRRSLRAGANLSVHAREHLLGLTDRGSPRAP